MTMTVLSRYSINEIPKCCVYNVYAVRMKVYYGKRLRYFHKLPYITLYPRYLAV